MKALGMLSVVAVMYLLYTYIGLCVCAFFAWLFA